MKTFMVILMGFIGVTTIYSQEKVASPKYALSFGIADNFRLDKFIMDIGITKVLDDSHQLRLFISPRISTNNQDEEDSRNLYKYYDKTFTNSFGIGSDFLWIFLSDEDFRMYGGPGLVYTIGVNNSKNTTEHANGDKFVRENKVPYYNVGFRGNLGVEWLVTKRISLHSEYVLYGLFSRQKTEVTTWQTNSETSKTTRTTSGFTLNTGVLFGVSIYL